MLTARKTIRGLKEWFPTFFWSGMLLGHFPLILRAAYRFGSGVESLSSGKSLLTLLVASAFFIFKLRGGRLLQTKPNLYQIVAFCLLGVFLHLFLFPPTVLDNPYEFLMLKCLVATVVGLTFMVWTALLRKGRRVYLQRGEMDLLFHLFRRMRWNTDFLCVVPVCLAVPSSGIIRRGPPFISSQV